MDFLEQPRWITSSGNAIDIGDTGPTGGLVMGQGEGVAPTWLVPTKEGQVLKSLGPTGSGSSAEIEWGLPPVASVNGNAEANASIYVPTSRGTDGYVWEATGTTSNPSWQQRIITSLNGSSTTRGSGIYAPTSGGTSGDALYSNGSGAPVWRDTYRCVISKPSSVPIYSKGGSAWNQGAYTLLGDAGFDSVDIDWYKGNTLAFRERQVRVSGSFSSDFWFRVPTGLANSNNYNITNATMLPLRSSISGGGVTFCAHHEGADSRYVYFGVDSGTTEDGACFIISIKNTAIIN